VPRSARQKRKSKSVIRISSLEKSGELFDVLGSVAGAYYFVAAGSAAVVALFVSALRRASNFCRRSVRFSYSGLAGLRKLIYGFMPFAIIFSLTRRLNTKHAVSSLLKTFVVQ
jgi:uncharacterized membrane protein